MGCKILAIDGHDGAGKTTLALELARRVDAAYVRPFGGAHGVNLMRAWRSSDYDDVVSIGSAALREVICRGERERIVLDRGWITVATLVPVDYFAKHWELWVPSVLLWCDLKATIGRLSLRDDEELESQIYHREFLEIYRQRRLLNPGPTLRTDLLSSEDCLAHLIELFSTLA